MKNIIMGSNRIIFQIKNGDFNSNHVYRIACISSTNPWAYRSAQIGNPLGITFGLTEDVIYSYGNTQGYYHISSISTTTGTIK